MNSFSPSRIVAVAALVSGAGCAHHTPVVATSSGTSSAMTTMARQPLSDAVSRDLARLRAATKPFHSLDSAVAVGYPREVPDCLVHAEHGAMGYHHVNRSYLTTNLSVERPQILLYERMPSGEYKLNGVEFIVPYRIWPRDSTPPTIMGQTLQHEDNLKIWYQHVWAWTDNADGLFASFNPAVHCPGNTGKVYTPYAAPPA